MTSMLFIWYIITLVASATSMITLKKYVLSHNFFFAFLTLLLYLLLFFGYIKILNSLPMHWLYPLLFISMVFILFSGYFFYGEKIKPINIIGILLGIIAIYLVIK